MSDKPIKMVDEVLGNLEDGDKFITKFGTNGLIVVHQETGEKGVSVRRTPARAMFEDEKGIRVYKILK